MLQGGHHQEDGWIGLFHCRSVSGSLIAPTPRAKMTHSAGERNRCRGMGLLASSSLSLSEGPGGDFGSPLSLLGAPVFRVASPGIVAAVCYRPVGGGLVEDSRVGFSGKVKQMSCQTTSEDAPVRQCTT